ncbi:hypothetical protein BGZ57DRAFT_851335 [Hyaloscypha finlandica]|nr:hypothetical protein BGZ57DRAFT_851335 [Hyaloscypha finlandica]
MTRFAQTFVLLIAFLSQVSLQDDSLALFPRVGGPPAPARQYVNNSTQISFQVGLAGRSLLNSSLDNRAGGCTDAGYSPCSNGNRVVVPTIAWIQGKPAATSDHALLVGIAALLGLAIQLVENAALRDIIVQPGTFAFSWMGSRNAAQIHTAQQTGSLITTTSPHAVPTEIAIYEYYYFTITWFYYSWYWTYSPAPAFMSTTFTLSTFTDITKYTTISVYATDSFAASGKNPAFITQVPFKLQDSPPCLIRSVKVTKPTTDSFLSISETYSGFTPAAATSILAETPFSSSSSPSATGSGFSGGRSGAESLKIGLGIGREPGYDQRGFGRRESNVNGFTNI